MDLFIETEEWREIGRERLYIYIYSVLQGTRSTGLDLDEENNLTARDRYIRRKKRNISTCTRTETGLDLFIERGMERERLEESRVVRQCEMGRWVKAQ